MVWTNRHRKIFIEYIEVLHKNNIKYFIYRNYADLPDKIPTNDIDIVIEPKYHSKAFKLLKQVYLENKIEYLKTVNYGSVIGCFGIDYSNSFVIEFDLLCGCVAMGGYEIVTFSQLDPLLILYHGFYVIPQELDTLLLFFYKILGWGKLKNTYAKELVNAVNSNKSYFNSFLINLLGETQADFIINSIKNNDFDNILEKHIVIKRSFKLKRWLNSPLTTFKLFCNYKYHRVLKSKKHQFICVESPDGTGKTTFILHLSKLFDVFFVGSEGNKSHICHFRPSILPNLGAAGEKAGVMKQDKNFTDPHRAKPVGFFSSFIRMTYYWLDYVIGMPLVLRKSAQFDKITIFDRYIYDFLIDPYRSRISLPFGLRKIFTRLVKQPKIVFVLDTDADTIYARKQELTKEEINRQLVEFRKLSQLGNRVHFLDAAKTPDEIANDAMKIVLDKFTIKL